MVAGGGSAADGLMGMLTKLLPGLDLNLLAKKPATAVAPEVRAEIDVV